MIFKLRLASQHPAAWQQGVLSVFAGLRSLGLIGFRGLGLGVYRGLGFRGLAV